MPEYSIEELHDFATVRIDGREAIWLVLFPNNTVISSHGLRKIYYSPTHQCSF